MKHRQRAAWPLIALTLGLALALPFRTAAQADDGALHAVDPSAQGYRVDNDVLQLKEHLRLPKNIDLRYSGWIDSRYRLANLISDEKRDFEADRIKKVVRVDTQTGEVLPTLYDGDIRCFVDGNLAVSVEKGRKEEWIFSIGRYGEALQTWAGGIPAGFVLNELGCKLVPSSSIPRVLNDGRRVDLPVQLRPEHGHLLIVRGRPLPAQTTEFSPELQRLMQQPFMRSMSVVSYLEDWILKTPEGREIRIPNNPGEAAVQYARFEYLPYLDAYFMSPYAGGRPFEPKDLRQVPTFARVLYPDGRVERLGVPDVIWEPYMRDEIGFNTAHTRRGLVFDIRPLKNFRSYRGELRPGAYLDLRDQKLLKRLPQERFGGGASRDGCTYGARYEVTQRRPYLLINAYYVNLCTGQ